MRKTAIVVLMIISGKLFGQYNPLWIPDTLSGTNFNLTIKDSMTQFRSGNQTITGGINGKFWGPTLFFNKGDEVHLNVKNNLNEATTIHWHGMHLPAVMDGGPHQVIPVGTTWQPFWKVTNHAATYWYHPHLHEMTMDHITKGVGGLIIVRDSIESALALPRKYGVDDIPVVLTDRSFVSASDNTLKVVPYGDSLLTNGVMRAEYTVPAQVVRFRILNGAIERSYNIRLADSSTFFVIASDGGLLNAPVSVNKYLLHAGERIEILINFTGKQGQSINLVAANSQLSGFIAGGENFTGGPFANALGHKDFNLLHINIGPVTGSPITSIPTALTTNVLIPESSANITRKLTITDSAIAGGAFGPNLFVLNHNIFKIDRNDYLVPINNTEIWEITSTSAFGHPFHIHDVEFNILTVNGAAPTAAQAGWKDVVFIPGKGPGPGGTAQVVRFIAKFDDYADSLHPFMYHCHIALHEDEGMMGQFVVTGKSTVGVQNSLEANKAKFSLFPNPAKDKIFVQMEEANAAYYVKILNPLGRVLYMLPRPDLKNGIDISNLKSGIYQMQLIDEKYKQVNVKSFVVE